ncbi:hypothetical protein Tco_1457417 [Tanacetum coccineum]
MMLDSIDNGQLVYPTVEENRQTRLKKYSELTEAQQLQDDCDVQATNIILHGLPPDVYSLVNHQVTDKDIWDRVKMLMKGTELSYQERECRFKFITDVKLAKSLYTANYDQLYAYLSQHERHANEVRITGEIYPDPLAFVANSPTLYNPSQSPQHSVTQQSQAKSPQLDSSLVFPMFQQGEDPIECINKAMEFLSAVASRFPPSNNQLRTSSNPKNQATIQDGRVTGNVVVGQPRVMKCYNYQGEGHMARQCTQPKRPRNVAWFKEKLMLAKSQEASQILDEEQLAFLADPGISEALVAQQTIPRNLAFQTDDLDVYDSDCDDLSSTKAVLMANLLSCDPEVLSKVPYPDSYMNDMINQDVQEM